MGASSTEDDQCLVDFEYKQLYQDQERVGGDLSDDLVGNDMVKLQGKEEERGEEDHLEKVLLAQEQTEDSMISSIISGVPITGRVAVLCSSKRFNA